MLRAAAILSVAALLATATPAAAEDVLLGRSDAPIKSVTVYSGQALVKRQAEFRAPAVGPLHVTIARLPPRIRDDSVRVRSGEGLTLLGSRIVGKPVGESSLPALQALRADLRKVKAEWESVNDDKWVSEQSIAHVDDRHPTTAQSPSLDGKTLCWPPVTAISGSDASGTPPSARMSRTDS